MTDLISIPWELHGDLLLQIYVYISSRDETWNHVNTPEEVKFETLVYYLDWNLDSARFKWTLLPDSPLDFHLQFGQQICITICVNNAFLLLRNFQWFSFRITFKFFNMVFNVLENLAFCYSHVQFPFLLSFTFQPYWLPCCFQANCLHTLQQLYMLLPLPGINCVWSTQSSVPILAYTAISHVYLLRYIYLQSTFFFYPLNILLFLFKESLLICHYYVSCLFIYCFSFSPKYKLY